MSFVIFVFIKCLRNRQTVSFYLASQFYNIDFYSAVDKIQERVDACSKSLKIIETQRM